MEGATATKSPGAVVGMGGTPHRGDTTKPTRAIRKKKYYQCVVELIDVDGKRTKVKTQGRMNITQHSLVLQVLTKRAQRFHQKKSVGLKESHHSWALDNTGTLDTSQLMSCHDSNIEQQEIRDLNNIELPEEVLQVHGFVPPKKTEGTVHLIYENVNGFNN